MSLLTANRHKNITQHNKIPNTDEKQCYNIPALVSKVRMHKFRCRTLFWKTSMPEEMNVLLSLQHFKHFWSNWESLQTGTRGSGYIRVGHHREPLSSREQLDDQSLKLLKILITTAAFWQPIISNVHNNIHAYNFHNNIHTNIHIFSFTNIKILSFKCIHM